MSDIAATDIEGRKGKDEVFFVAVVVWMLFSIFFSFFFFFFATVVRAEI